MIGNIAEFYTVIGGMKHILIAIGLVLLGVFIGRSMK